MNSFSPVSLPADPLATSFATTYAGVVAFIAVVTEGNFARAAERLGVGRSAVSRSVQKLEDQLDVRLLQRTTRSTALTREGDLFYANCHPGLDQIVKAVEEMKDLRTGTPRGHLSVSASAGFGRKVVAPLLHEFQTAYPEVSVDLLLSDKPADFTSDRVDIEFRSGRLEDSQIIARKIIPMQMLICGSRQYMEANGPPVTVEDLARHECINFRTGSGRISEWEFMVGGQVRRFLPKGKLTYNDPQLILQAVLDGQGIAQLPGHLVCDAVRSGALVACLEEYETEDLGHYLCYHSREHMPARMRVFIDFMTTRIRAAEFQCVTVPECSASA